MFSQSILKRGLQVSLRRYLPQRNINSSGLLSSTDHPISRYPIVADEDVGKMPDDIKERMEEVKEKVRVDSIIFIQNLFNKITRYFLIVLGQSRLTYYLDRQ